MALVPVEQLQKPQSLVQRYVESPEYVENLARFERGEEVNANELIAQILTRGITSATSALPVRENLEDEAFTEVTEDYPLISMLPRTPGSGFTANWRAETSFGTGLGTLAKTTGTTNTANTFVVSNAEGFFAGETILYNNASTHTISSIDYATGVITVGASPGVTADSQLNNLNIIKLSSFWTQQELAEQIFYAEGGAPAERTTAYVNRSSAYRLLGSIGSITGFAMAGGANFTNQYEKEKGNQLRNTRLQEEWALLHSKSGVTRKPHGDGSTALGFQGLIPFIDANAPASNIQSSVGALTLRHLDQQITRIVNAGGQDCFILCNAREMESLGALLTGTGNYRIVIGDQGNVTAGVKVGTYISSATGQTVRIMMHKFMPAGTIVFGALKNQRGQATAEVDVLPQVQLPESAFADGIQGYFAQDIAPARATPQVYAFMVSVFMTVKWKSGKFFAISRGVTAAA